MILWYPGACGGRALAKVLFGDSEPGGKLPVTFYKDLAELPDFTDYSMKGRTYRYMENPAQYPFGYGLSYGDVQVRKADFAYECTEEDGFRAVLAVQAVNRSERKSSDVIQVYMKNLESELAIPNPALCGFARVSLEPGERTTVTIPLSEAAFQVIDEEGCRITDGKRFRIYVGTCQPDPRSTELTGKRPMEMDVEVVLE